MPWLWKRCTVFCTRADRSLLTIESGRVHLDEADERLGGAVGEQLAALG
jgi:hypothetical protein